MIRSFKVVTNLRKFELPDEPDDDKNVLEEKFIMRFKQIVVFIWMILIFSSCSKDPNHLSAINSESFHETKIQLHFRSGKLMATDSLANNDRSALSQGQNLVLNQLDEMVQMTKQTHQSGSDSVWVHLIKKWNRFNTENFGNGITPFSPYSSPSDSAKSKLFPQEIQKWAELNVDLVKLSGEVRFGDVLEKLVYDPDKAHISEKLLKSVIYTHVFDQIFINIIGSSSMDYQHTTGGNVRIIQETNYPQGNEMTLKVECNDFRYMDVFIRIPLWAVNPTVSHGNVKYVARPGEYTQISKKWLTGDEIRVVLKN
jgi:hypothetical protein